MSEWVEYLTREGDSPMVRLRKANGRDEPWRVKFWGTWWDVEPGINPGFLFQQNTLRDALVATSGLK
ncbi:hypothetical protein [Streptomyces scopuliridis]|uniref:hypothetical protein n=1 Tax=Streptomyces scopuliridis TaxID=452529 RepID=UPI0036BF9617